MSFLYVFGTAIQAGRLLRRGNLKERSEEKLGLLITECNFSQIYAASFQYNSKVLRDSIYLISKIERCVFKSEIIFPARHVAQQTLYEITLDLAVPNLNDVVKTEGYDR